LTRRILPKPTVDSLIILDNWPYGHKLGLHGMRFALLLEVCGSRFVYAPEVRRTCPQIRLSALTRRIQLEVQVQGAGPSPSHGHGDAWKTCDRHAPTLRFLLHSFCKTRPCHPWLGNNSHRSFTFHAQCLRSGDDALGHQNTNEIRRKHFGNAYTMFHDTDQES